ncbi:hypothetical protein [Paenibacillus xylaniclasticus]|uniref:hypothetical protein n=1 Tax=Paenibacillus xylaniclasticus TaxID=588083 RepID=UPI000FD8D474|nr:MULTISPECIES: hypothetical protein [Paenibacillus]GFN30355.1 hypothetical protein PCURB6_06150 [Paenibacillus curdlanolyticus]
MDQQRKKIIVQEIHHWRRSKLLPDRYCDFLLNLYADEQEEDNRSSSRLSGRAAQAVLTASGKQWLLAIVFFSFICFVVLHFTAFHPLLQIGVTAVGFILLLLYGQRVRRKNEPAGIAIVGSDMLGLLGMGIYLLKQHNIDSWGAQAALLAGCAILWIIYGIAARMALLHFAGWAALLLLYAWALSRRDDVPSWYEIQLYWLPMTFVFAWFSWFTQRWSRSVAMVLFGIGCLVWFMPELYSTLFIEDYVLSQLVLFVKIAIGGGLLFGLRKQWIAWVSS